MSKMYLPDIIPHMPPRARSIRAEAIVLRHSNLGEADRLLWLYTRGMGKVRAIAKGVRKIRSRKAGHLEPFTRVSLQLARGRELFIVTQAETIDAYLSLRDDLTLIGYAAYVVELLDRFTYDEDENRAFYRLLANTLSRLNEETSPILPVRYYEIRSLDLLGYRPQLFKCVGCEAEIQPEDQFFSVSQGGVLCPGCGQEQSDASFISMTALKYVRHFQRSTYTESRRANLTPKLNREIELIMQHYFRYLLERELNTLSFLKRVRTE